MIPRFDVQIKISAIDADDLRVMWLDDVSEDGIGDNRLYRDLSGMSWDEVWNVITAEEELIVQASRRAENVDEFDHALNAIFEERYPDDEEYSEEGAAEGPLWQLADLDVGVMSAVAALSAAGCLSTTSCRGHRGSGELYPLVRFTTERRRLEFIQSSASSARCGLFLDQDGMLQLYAANVLDFIAFAREILRRREKFDGIEDPVALPRPDVYVDDFVTDVRQRDVDPSMGQSDVGQVPGQLTISDIDNDLGDESDSG